MLICFQLKNQQRTSAEFLPRTWFENVVCMMVTCSGLNVSGWKFWNFAIFSWIDSFKTYCLSPLQVPPNTWIEKIRNTYLIPPASRCKIHNLDYTVTMQAISKCRKYQHLDKNCMEGPMWWNVHRPTDLKLTQPFSSRFGTLLPCSWLIITKPWGVRGIFSSTSRIYFREQCFISVQNISLLLVVCFPQGIFISTSYDHFHEVYLFLQSTFIATKYNFSEQNIFLSASTKYTTRE